MRDNSELTQNQKNLLAIVGEIEDKYSKALREQPSIAMGAVILTEVANITDAMKAAIAERNYEEMTKLSKNLKQTIEQQVNNQELLPTIRKDFDALIERFDTLVFSVKRDKDKPIQEFQSGIWNPEAGVYKGKMTLQQTSSSNSYKLEQTTPYTSMPITPTSQYGDIPRSTTPTEEANPKNRGNMKDFIIKKFGEFGNSTLATPNKVVIYSEKYMKAMAELTTLADNKNYDEMQKVLTRFENETKGMLQDSKAAEPIISEIQKEILANKEKEREIAQAKPAISTPQKKLERTETQYGQLLSDEALAKKQKPALPPKNNQYGDIPRSPKETEQANPQLRGSMKEDMLKDEQTVKATTSITSETQKEIRANKEKEEALAKAKPVPTPPIKQEKPMTDPTPKVAQTVTVTQTVVTTTTQTPSTKQRLVGKTAEEFKTIRAVVEALKSGNATELKAILSKEENQFIKKQINVPFDARGVKLADYASNQEVAKILQDNGAKIDPVAMNKLPKATNLAPEAFKKENKAQKFASKVTAIAKGFAAKVTTDKNNNKGGKVR